MAEKKEKFERRVDFIPAFDRMAEGFGVGSVEIRFVLKGQRGAVQLLLGTDWYPVHIQRNGMRERMMAIGDSTQPKAWDLGYHSPKPMYEGQQSLTEKCPILNNRRCYYDGSSLRGAPLRDLLLEKGSEAVWAELEKEYRAVFSPTKEEK